MTAVLAITPYLGDRLLALTIVAVMLTVAIVAGLAKDDR